MHFERGQETFFPSILNDHSVYFTWSSERLVAVGDSNSGDYLFCDENHKQAVDCIENIYYALSNDEWKYLFNINNEYGETCRSGKYKYGVTISGNENYVVIAPDDWNLTANPLQDNYDKSTWEAAETAGLVCLPPAKYRRNSAVMPNNEGHYWSSSSSSNSALSVMFTSSSITIGKVTTRALGYSIRLVTDVK